MSILKAVNIQKIYPGTVALNNVSVEFDSGKVHALIGKNGSGKSTLVKIFSGAETRTTGEIYLDDKLLQFNSPNDSQVLGISTVYQELSLIPSLSVTENIFLGRLPKKGGLVDWNKAYSQTKELLDDLNVEIDPKALVGELSMWQCQMLEIVKAMSTKPKVLFLDEPTSSLANNETELLFKMIRELKKKDVIIIYISHRLQELWKICDTCVVLRDGNFIGKTVMAETTSKQLVEMMFGDVQLNTRPADLKISEEVILEAKNLTRANHFTDINFKLRKSEILGIAGMLGSGRTELLKSIFGADKFDSGEIIFDGKSIKNPNPEKMKKLGIALTPEDRKHEGLVQIMSIADNLCVAGLDYISKNYFIQKEKEKLFIDSQVENLQIKAGSVLNPVSSLSGGNQQKVVVGNWLNTSPKVMFFDEPSRGIDVNAKQQIFKIIWEQSRKGIASVMVSSELEELLEVCHRILILRRGKIVGEVFPENTTVEQIYSICMTE